MIRRPAARELEEQKVVAIEQTLSVLNEYLKRTAATIDELRGWDFSRMQTDIDPVPWDYTEVVRGYLHPTSRVLDIGTGGGEKFLALAPHFGTGVGTDVSPAMIQTARENMPPEPAAKIAFVVMPAEALAFPDASFDVVLNRHAPLSVDEVLRVLRPAGVFITQQVGDHNAQNIFEALGWPSNRAWWEQHHPAHGEPVPPTMDELVPLFEHAGCRILRRDSYDVPYYFRDVDSLVFWLKAGVVPMSFADDDQVGRIARFIEQHRTPRGIQTNEERDLLIVQKQKLCRL